MYSGSSARLGSLTMPERLSVETRYWSIDPFEGAAVAETVFVDLRRDAAQGEEAVVAELGFVFGERHASRRANRVCRFRSAASGYSGCFSYSMWSFISCCADAGVGRESRARMGMRGSSRLRLAA